MLQFDQESGQPRRSPIGPSGAAGTSGQALAEIAREIEDAQRQQTESMAGIVERLRAIDDARPGIAPRRAAPGRAGGGAAAPRSALRRHLLLEEAGDEEPWDAGCAETLMESYEAAEREPLPPAAREAMSYSQQAWIDERFNDVTHRITQALADLKAGPAVAMLEERMDAFQAHISAALQDVARRSDLEGLRLIGAHVADLSGKLGELEAHVSRIDGIESDMRTLMAQVADERLAKLFDYDSRFAADLEAVARRAAEEVQARLRTDPAELAERHDDLRRLIEAALADRREADAQAASLVSALSGRVSVQSGRYDELKALLEQAIREQRQNEQAAISMLDTVQQALVTVLDRMDALEQQRPPHPQEAAPAPSPAQGPIVGPPPQDVRRAEPTPLPAEPAAASDAPYSFRDTRFDGFGAKDVPEPAAPVEVPAAFSDPSAPAEAPVPEEPESPLDRLRRDFIADARRAKLKAAANRAEALGEQAEAQKPGMAAEARDALTQPESDVPASGGPGRLFGMSTKLLAGVLALIIAINGSLLLINRKPGSRPAAPEIARPAATEPYGAAGTEPQAPAAPGHDAPEPPAEAPGPGPRSDVGEDEGRTPAPESLHGDAVDPPRAEPSDHSMSGIPSGMTITRSGTTLADAAMAGVYEQQMLASLSGQLGLIAAGQSADAMLPEVNGRIAAAYPAPALDPSREAPAAANTPDLPPATVGPMSLRLAAANGDPSAEFEVGARLAEGKGTGQDYAAALRWYQRAATKGFAQAQYRVGTFYERGLGVAKDLERAKVWYQRAAEGGNLKSMHNLAVLTAGGERPNYAGAMPWFLKAAEHGLADSQYNLGVLLENGLGAPADRIAAYKWYALAAKSGDDDATQRRDALESALGAEELATANRLIAAFQARPASPLANDARTAGEDWKKRVNTDANT